MKKTLVLAIVAGMMLISSAEVRAVNYYVDATGGNDTNNGQSDAMAWRTISKVNNYRFQTGDDVYFKCGQTWTEELLYIDWSGTAGNRAVVGAYEVVTFPIPLPSDYEPILTDPEFFGEEALF